jgi:hypothetical protein
MKKKGTILLAVLFMAVFLYFMVRSTFQAGRYRCEVCMEFEGRRDCRSASAETREHAIRTAVDYACAQIAGGVTETSRCTGSRPASIRWIE